MDNTTIDNSNLSRMHNSLTGAIQPVGPVPESFIGVLWRNRWLVLATVLAAVTAGFVFITKTTPIYTSTSRLYVEQTGPRIMTEMEEGVMTRSKNYLYTQTELIRSTPILSAALDQSGFRQMKSLRRIDNPVPYLKKQLQARVGKKDDIVSVSFSCPYPQEAAQIVNEVVDAYVTYYSARKRSTSAEVLKILQKEKAQRSAELSERLKAMMDFRKRNIGLTFDANQGNPVLSRLERLSIVLTEAQLTTIEAQSLYESAKQMIDDPEALEQYIEVQRTQGTYVSTGNQKSQLHLQLEALQHRRADRLRLLTTEHPGVLALDAEIDWIQIRLSQLDKQFAQAQLKLAQQQHMMAEEKEKKIAEHFEQQWKKASSLNEQLAQYAIIQSEYEQTKKLCDILDDRIKELNITEDTGALNISILEVARAASEPSHPQKARIMAIALVLGMLAGGGLSQIRDWMDQKLRTSEEVSNILGVPILGVIPSMSKKLSATGRGLVVGGESNSMAAEAYRTVRTALFYSLPKSKAKTILITSPAAGEGKSTLSSNLAIAMAQSGQRTLIIDADFRRPSQHQIFGIDKKVGLSGVLAGSQTLAGAIRRTFTESLHIMTCGHDVANPSELLGSDEFRDILTSLAGMYDRIIIDAPPVMSVTDACILAAITDVTMLVLRANLSTRRGARAAHDALLRIGANILGVVVNDVSSKNGNYAYYGYSDSYDRRTTKPTAIKSETDNKPAFAGQTLTMEASR